MSVCHVSCGRVGPVVSLSISIPNGHGFRNVDLSAGGWLTVPGVGACRELERVYALSAQRVARFVDPHDYTAASLARCADLDVGIGTPCRLTRGGKRSACPSPASARYHGPGGSAGWQLGILPRGEVSRANVAPRPGSPTLVAATVSPAPLALSATGSDAVSDAGNGFDRWWLAEFAAQPTDGDVDGFGEGVGVLVPDLFE